MNRIPLGARYMLLSAFAFSIMSLFVKLAGQRIPAHELVTARAVVSLVLSYVMLKQRGIPIWGNRKGILFARGLVGFFALICVYYGLTVLPLAEATVIQYLHPIFTAVIAMLFLGERPGAAVVGCIVLSFAGLLLVARPPFLFEGLGAGWEPLAVGAAVLGAFGSGVAYVLVRKLSATEDPLVIVFYFPLVALPGTIPFLMANAVWPRGIEWLYLLGIGVFTQIGQVALTQGIRLETAARATSFSYLQVVFATVWGVLFFAEIPAMWTLAGAALIVAGTFLSMGDSRRANAG
jgi:drug/metabolite transporter (DMT)-like permease